MDPNDPRLRADEVEGLVLVESDVGVNGRPCRACIGRGVQDMTRGPALKTPWYDESGGVDELDDPGPAPVDRGRPGPMLRRLWVTKRIDPPPTVRNPVEPKNVGGDTPQPSETRTGPGDAAASSSTLRHGL